MKIPKIIYENEFDEKIINNFRHFHDTHLSKIKKRKLLSAKIENIILEHEKITNPSSNNTSYLIFKTEVFLKKNFQNTILELYNKKPPKQKKSKSFEPKTNSTLGITLELISKFNLELNKQNVEYWNSRIQFIKYLNDCIKFYGLHPFIKRRTTKRFNLVVKHSFKSKSEIDEYQILMSFEVFNRNFFNNYKYKQPIKINGKIIPYNDITQVRITTTYYNDNELILFAEKNGIKWNKNDKDTIHFIQNTKDETDKYQPIPIEVELTNINETTELLKKFPKPYELYCEATRKVNDRSMYRNSLDDLRLAIELLLKKILNNNKSLENQKSELGKFLKDKKITIEIRSTFITILDYYTKCHNHNVKHDNTVEETDIKLMFNLSTEFIRYLLE